MLRLRQDDTDAALRVFMPVVEEALADDAIGLLLLEPPALLQALLTLISATQPGLPGWARLLERLANWPTDGESAPASPPQDGSAAGPAHSPGFGLSQREQEELALLAEGMSNKRIARRRDARRRCAAHTANQDHGNPGRSLRRCLSLAPPAGPQPSRHASP